MVPSGPPLGPQGWGGQVSTPKRHTPGFLSSGSRCGSGSRSSKGCQPASLRRLGPRSPPAQLPLRQQEPHHPESQADKRTDLLGPKVFRHRYQPCSRAAASSSRAGGLSPRAPPLCLFSQCVCISVSALPTGGNAFKKISVINVVSFVASHCKGGERGFIFLTCLA